MTKFTARPLNVLLVALAVVAAALVVIYVLGLQDRLHDMMLSKEGHEMMMKEMEKEAE